MSFAALLKKRYPNYDNERYRFQPGDLVEMPCGAILLCKYSYVMECVFYVVKRSFVYNEYKEYLVSYTDIPRLMEAPINNYKIWGKLKWKVGKIIIDDRDTVAYLYKEVSPQAFYGFVLRTDNPYYLHTGIYITSPIYYYVKECENGSRFN